MRSLAPLLALCLIPATEARPQESGTYVHLSYIRSQPPPGVNTEPGNYFGAGLTLRGQSPHLYGLARARGGVDLAANSPDWGELSAFGGAEATLGRHVALGLAASGFLLGYSGLSEYRAWAGMAQPSVRLALGRFGFLAQGRGWHGRTSVLLGEGGNPFFGGGFPAQRVTTDLQVAESSFDAWVVPSSAVSLGLGADLALTDTVTYTGGRAWLSARPTGRSELVGSVLVRQGAGKTETGFMAVASYELEKNVELELMLMRTLADLLLGSQQTVAAVATIQFKIGKRPEKGATNAGAAARGERPVAEILNGEPGSDARQVRFAISAQAQSVALVGDFTDWQAAQMRRSSGRRWVLERALSPGVYRYAFLVDGSWHVPEGAAGQVDDGFGQKNLILVVPAK